MVLRSTKYADVLAEAGQDNRIERLKLKPKKGSPDTPIEIRFSWWKGGSRMAPRPLDLPEEKLLPLLREAIEKVVFSEEFCRELHSILYDCRKGQKTGRSRNAPRP